MPLRERVQQPPGYLGAAVFPVVSICIWALATRNHLLESTVFKVGDIDLGVFRFSNGTALTRFDQTGLPLDYYNDGSNLVQKIRHDLAPDVEATFPFAVRALGPYPTPKSVLRNSNWSMLLPDSAYKIIVSDVGLLLVGLLFISHRRIPVMWGQVVFLVAGLYHLALIGIAVNDFHTFIRVYMRMRKVTKPFKYALAKHVRIKVDDAVPRAWAKWIAAIWVLNMPLMMAKVGACLHAAVFTDDGYDDMDV